MTRYYISLTIKTEILEMKLSKPLAGIKILELSTVVTGSLAATILSEQGAETVKVEPIGIGDTLRHLGTNRAGVSSMFVNCNRGKRSIAVDLKSEAGLTIVRKLAAEADVLISNFRTGVLDRLGLGSEPLRKANPNLIVVAITGFGTEGPLAGSPAYDHVIQALTGYADMQGMGDDFEMVKTFVCDEITAYTVTQATTAALLQRVSTGKGQHIDISMLDSALYFLWPAGMGNLTFEGDDVNVRPLLKHTYRMYKTSDGFISMAALTDAHWNGLFEGTGRQDLAQDPRYSTMQGRAVNSDALMAHFKDAFVNMSSAEAESLLHSLDIAGNALLTVEDVLEHPQVKAVSAVQTQQHNLLGTVRSPAHPARFDSKQFEPSTPLGALGEHTKDVLADLGYSDQECAQLIASGAVAT